MLHHRSLLAADVLPSFTSILPYITGRRYKIKMRKRRGSRSDNKGTQYLQREDKGYIQVQHFLISGNKTLVVDWQPAGTLLF